MNKIQPPKRSTVSKAINNGVVIKTLKYDKGDTSLNLCLGTNSETLVNQHLLKYLIRSAMKIKGERRWEKAQKLS